MSERWVWRCIYKNEWWFWKAGEDCRARSRATFPSEAKAQAALERHIQKASHSWTIGRGGLVWKLKIGAEQ